MLNLKNRIRTSVALLIFAVLTLSLGVSTPAHAVRVKYKKQRQVNKELTLPWSVQLAIDEQIDDNDEEYSGIRFSFSHFFTGTQAIRVSMGVGDRNFTYDENKVYHRGDAMYVFDKYTEYDVSSVNFSIQGMFYSSPRPEPRFYFGFGPRFEFGDANPVVYVSYFDDPLSEPVDYDDGSKVSFGLEGTFGFEMFLGPQLSMMAELETAFQKDWYILEFNDYYYYGYYDYRDDDTEIFGNRFHFGATRFKFGMSLYF